MDSILIGFGYRARCGKDASVAAILKARAGVGEGKFDARRYAFADELKREALAGFFNHTDEYWDFLGTLRKQPVSSFMRRVSVVEDGCWLWQGKRSDRGYGIVYTQERENYRAHKFMWEVVLGNDPAPLLRHRCDVRQCVNPLHLEAGTSADNSTDMVERKRSANGERHSQVRVPDEVVEQVRSMCSQGTSQADICRLLDMNSSTVSRIVNYETRTEPTYEVLEGGLQTKFSAEWMSDEHKAKFRKLLQHWGTEYRREVDPNYWVAKLQATIERERPRIALIADCRFPNEISFIKSDPASGFVCRVDRLGYEGIGSSHSSETLLGWMADEDWHYILQVPDGQLEELQRDAVVLFDHIVDSLTPPDLTEFTNFTPKHVIVEEAA